MRGHATMRRDRGTSAWPQREGIITTEKVTGTEQIYRGHVVSLRVDQVTLASGRPATREVVEHQGAVAIAAVDDQGRIAMVRQYRHPVAMELDELPAGKLERGEDPLAAARRELEEETGQVADSWDLLADFFTTPGFSDERMRLYLARDLRPGRMHLDDDEELEAFWVDLKKAVELALDGQYRDGKTIAGILAAAGRLGGGRPGAGQPGREQLGGEQPGGGQS